MQLPNVLPDETLFSRIVRYLSSSGLLKDQFLIKLVGERRAVIHPYLTADLMSISRFTSESAHELSQIQTLRPLFGYYLPKYRENILDYSIRTNQLIRACQISTFRESETLSVKFCPLCACDDIRNFGVAYWHCAHQMPGVEACFIHGVWLSHYVFSEREHIRDMLLPTPNDNFYECGIVALQFAQFSESKLRFIQENHLRKPEIVKYKSLFVDKGILTRSRRVKRIRLMAELHELTDKILPKNHPLSIKSRQDFRYISSLIDGMYTVHPFKHLLMEFFLNKIIPSTYSEQGCTTVNKSENLYIDIETRCCNLLLRGLSMAQVSREIGKSRCYIKSVALKYAIHVNLKPKKLTTEVKEKIVEMAYKGFNRAAIAKCMDISSGSVEQIISTTDNLVEWRKKCKSDSLRRRHQCQILRYLQSHPDSNRQQIKESCGAAFFWLYSHCPNWLEKFLPEARETQHVDRVNWRERDDLLSQKVTSILERSERILSRTELDKMLGAHGWLTSKKKKLPLTLKAYYAFYVLKLR
ncbi:transposase [Vibrio cholerae]|nr:transposase [Vibrio cholerae]EGR0451255.1 transposase [Vibrio cholerae]MVB23154.1 transposase [Vibrio cholerae]MVB51072.1 transposase [Vibrio cholerae]HDI3279201.1 TniQ family protein [Vibrio cholerae]